MSGVPEKNHGLGHCHRSPILPIVFAIGLAVVAALSVGQHKELERLRRAGGDETHKQVSQTYLLMRRLTHLQQQFNQQTAMMENKLQGDAAEMMQDLTALSKQINQSRQQVEPATDRSRWAEQTVAQFSPGVCLIQGEYIFVDPGSGQPLRYIEENTSTGGGPHL